MRITHRQVMPVVIAVCFIVLIASFLYVTQSRYNVINEMRREQREATEKKASEHVKILEHYYKSGVGYIEIFEVNGRKFITINGDTLPYADNLNSSK